MLKSYFYSVLCQNDLDLGFSSRSDHRERLNSAERVNDIRHPINLRLFNWRVPAQVFTQLSPRLVLCFLSDPDRHLVAKLVTSAKSASL